MMTRLMIVLSLLAPITYAADIQNSNYELRHQKAIINAITEECGSGDEYFLLSSSEKRQSVDQGITDTYFTTQIKKRYYVEKLKFIDTIVIVESALFDSYDHENETWGNYHVKNVICN